MEPPSRFKIFLVFGQQTPEHLMRWNEPDELAGVTNGSEGSTTGTARQACCIAVAKVIGSAGVSVS